MNNTNKVSEYEYSKVPINEKTPEKDSKPIKYGYGVRHIQLLIFLLCLTVSIIGRAHMGVTIVAMTSTQNKNSDVSKETINSISNNNTNTLEDLGNGNMKKELDGNTLNLNEKEKLENVTEVQNMVYIWPKPVQEMVLNAFFLGYTIMMLPMGMLCQRFGGKLPLQISLAVNAVASIVTPWLTTWGGWKATCACRIVQGLSQAGTYPSLQALLAKWVPVNERATMSACVYTGLSVGTVIAYQIAGFLAASRWNWPSTFYVVGVITFICFILITVLGAATPLEHKSITDEERNYITGEQTGEKPKKLKTPWRAIFKSKPLYGTIISQVSCTVSFAFFFNQVPTYIHYILNVNVRNSGLLSSLPYVASTFSTVGFGWFSDFCINRNIISIKTARRICNSMSLWGLAVCLILTSYTDKISIAVSCLVLALTLNMGGHAGWMVNFIDLASNFSGTLTAIGNTLANICVLLTSFIVSSVLTDMTNQFQWRILFFIIAGFTIFCSIVFILLMSTDTQPWNHADYNNTSVEDPVKDEVNNENLEKA